MQIEEIKVAEVGLPIGRKVRGDISRLVESIGSIGLLHPICVVRAKVVRDHGSFEGYRLVAGLNRLESHKALGLETIAAEVLEIEDLEERLIEIDENLARVNLTVIEEGEQHGERKRIAEALGAARAAGNPKLNSDTVSELAKAYTDQAATANRESARSIQRKIQIADKIDPGVKDKIRDTDLADSTSELLKLARASPDAQHEMVDAYLAGETDTLKRKKKRASKPRISERQQAGDEFAALLIEYMPPAVWPTVETYLKIDGAQKTRTAFRKLMTQDKAPIKRTAA